MEKPISAEDHNVHIYFPSAAGGGSQQLFRKVSACACACVRVCACVRGFVCGCEHACVCV